MKNTLREALAPTDSKYYYSAYGLNIKSEIQLPELPQARGPTDLEITCGPVAQSLEVASYRGDIFQTTGDRTLLLLKRKIGADFLISNGRRIQVNFQSASQLPKIRLAILGYCFTALFFQRKFLVLHGNALLSPQGAIAICGHQKAGKSTTTMGLYQRGYSVIADDLTVVGTKCCPQVQPGIPRLKLWADTLSRFHESSKNLTRILPEIEKYNFSVEQGFHGQVENLKTVYILKKGDVDKVVARQLNGVEKLAGLTEQIRSYLPHELPHGSLWLLRTCSVFAEKINVIEIERPANGDSIDEVVDLIEMDQCSRDSGKLISQAAKMLT